MVNWYKILIIFSIPFIFSATIYVPEDFEIIQDAVDFAEEYDSIFVDSGNYPECLEIEEKSISIIGNPQEYPTIACVVELGIVFQMMNFTQKSVNISNFKLNGNGIARAIKFNETTLGLYNIECEDFDESAIYGSNSFLNAENLIINNPGENAKFYIQFTNSDVVLNSGELSNLASNELNSKILYAIGSTIQINNFLIQNNLTFDDGTFRIFNSQFSANNITFNNNHLEFGQGGAIYSFQSDLDISNSVFENNSAPIGGAISAQSSKVNLFNSIFKNNSSNSGGAISHSSDSLFIKNTQFESNQSENGGALHIFSSFVEFHKSLCRGNFSNLSGGCMSIVNGELSLTFSNILKNESFLRENIKSNNSQIFILNSIFEKVDYLYDNFQFYDETQAYISNSIFEFSDLQNIENDNIVITQNNFNSERLNSISELD